MAEVAEANINLLRESGWKGIKKILNTSKNESANWKQTLSGALSDGHLFASLVILGIFYVGYAMVNAYHDNHDKDEDHITLQCRCDSGHRRFYVGWFTTCTVLWFLAHVFLQFYKYWGDLKQCCNCKRDNEYTISKKFARLKNSSRNVRYDGFCSFCCRCCSFLQEKIRVIEKYLKVEYHRDIFRFQQYLVSQYYELYVT